MCQNIWSAECEGGIQEWFFLFFEIIIVCSPFYIAWFMTLEAATLSTVASVTYSAPSNVKDYSRGFTSLLFTFAGHSSNIEVADVMNDQKTYDLSYFYSFLYVFTLTMPVSMPQRHTPTNTNRNMQTHKPHAMKYAMQSMKTFLTQLIIWMYV